MRLATLIIGLLAGLFFILFGFINVIAAGAVNGSDTASFDQAAAAFWGGLFTWLFAVGLVIPFPLISVAAFSIAAIVLLQVDSEYGYLILWGAFSIILAITSLLGWFGKRKESRDKKAEALRQKERDDRLETMLARQHGTTCPSCGAVSSRGTKFCGECGTALSSQAI